MAPVAAGWQGRALYGHHARATSTMRTSSCSRFPSGARKVVHRGGYHGRYLPSGHLVYLHDGVLLPCHSISTGSQSTGQATAVLERRDVDHVDGRRTVCRVGRRDAGVSYRGRRSREVPPFDWMDRARDHDAVMGQLLELVQRPFRSRWTPDRDGTFIAEQVSTSGSTSGSRDMATPLTRNAAYAN